MMSLPLEEHVPFKSLEEEEDIDPFMKQMTRGEYLRQLRLLALQDEMERMSEETLNSAECSEEKKCDDLQILKKECDEVQILPNGERMLNYTQYLSHQRYYDDLKHIDMHYINYGKFDKNVVRVESSNDVRNIDTNTAGRITDGHGDLIVEQRKSLGKGSFCWDAAFILGEHVISCHNEWTENTTVLELGAGTGLCGLMLAKATNAHVTITDLPELVGLMQDNIRRNFASNANIEPRTLRWGVKEDYGDKPCDVIVGGDIVASLYDPIALAQTLHALSGPTTKIYISSKSRLDKPHEEFDKEMKRLFEKVDRVLIPESRLKNPTVFVMTFEGKKVL